MVPVEVGFASEEEEEEWFDVFEDPSVGNCDLDIQVVEEVAHAVVEEE